MNDKLTTSLSIILNFAAKYAEGDRFDWENFNEAKKIIDEEIKKLEKNLERWEFKAKTSYWKMLQWKSAAHQIEKKFDKVFDKT